MAGCIAGMIVLPITIMCAMVNIAIDIFRTMVEMAELAIKLFGVMIDFVCYLCEKYQKLKGRSNHD